MQKLNDTDKYYALIDKTEALYKQLKLDRAIDPIDVVHDLILEYSYASLENPTKKILKAYNRIKAATHKGRMGEQALDRGKFKRKYAQQDRLSIDENRLIHNAANKAGHYNKRKDNPVWAHERDMKNADIQKQRCHNDEEYRLKKNARNRKSYQKTNAQKVMDRGEAMLSGTAVNTLVTEVNVNEKMNSAATKIVNHRQEIASISKKDVQTVKHLVGKLTIHEIDNENKFSQQSKFIKK
jgi:hypothetical protein